MSEVLVLTVSSNLFLTSLVILTLSLFLCKKRVINYVIMTSQCAQCTSKIHKIKKTGILTIVMLFCYNTCNIGAETWRK